MVCVGKRESGVVGEVDGFLKSITTLTYDCLLNKKVFKFGSHLASQRYY